MLDRSVNVRLPQDLLHRLEMRVAKVNSDRTAAMDSGRKFTLPDWLKDGAHTMSDEIRRALRIGLDVLEGDADEIEDVMASHFATRIQELLARAIVDPKATKSLKRIADSVQNPEFDFG